MSSRWLSLKNPDILGCCVEPSQLRQAPNTCLKRLIVNNTPGTTCFECYPDKQAEDKGVAE